MKKNKTLLVGLAVAVPSFLLILGGIKFAYSGSISIQNVIAYVVIAAILGGISAGFYHYKLIHALQIFIIGIVIGYFEMFKSFSGGSDGWGDLAGLLSLFAWIVIGFLIGIIVQISVNLFKKISKK